MVLLPVYRLPISSGSKTTFHPGHLATQQYKFLRQMSIIIIIILQADSLVHTLKMKANSFSPGRFFFYFFSLGRFFTYLFSLGGGPYPNLLGSCWVRAVREAGTGTFSQDNPQDLVSQLRLHIARIAEDLRQVRSGSGRCRWGDWGRWHLLSLSCSLFFRAVLSR